MEGGAGLGRFGAAAGFAVLASVTSACFCVKGFPCLRRNDACRSRPLPARLALYEYAAPGQESRTIMTSLAYIAIEEH